MQYCSYYNGFYDSQKGWAIRMFGAPVAPSNANRNYNYCSLYGQKALTVLNDHHENITTTSVQLNGIGSNLYICIGADPYGTGTQNTAWIYATKIYVVFN